MYILYKNGKHNSYKTAKNTKLGKKIRIKY